MAKEVGIHITANNLPDSEYKKLIAALESVVDKIKSGSEEPIIIRIENEKMGHQALALKVSR